MSHPSSEELKKMLQEAGEIVPPETYYRHYSSGEIYRVIGHALLKSSDEVAVIYEPVSFPDLNWITSLGEFTESVAVADKLTPRFTLVPLEELGPTL